MVRFPPITAVSPRKEFSLSMKLIRGLWVGAILLLVSQGCSKDPDVVKGVGSYSPIISGLALIVTGIAMGMYGLTRVLPGKAAFVETTIGPFERGLTSVYYSVLGALVVLAGAIRALAPGALTRLRDTAIAAVLELAK